MTKIAQKDYDKYVLYVESLFNKKNYPFDKFDIVHEVLTNYTGDEIEKKLKKEFLKNKRLLNTLSLDKKYGINKNLTLLGLAENSNFKTINKGDRQCSRCFEIKSESEFRVYHTYCKSCMYKANKAWLKSYRKRKRETDSEYRERMILKSLEWYYLNRDKAYENSKKWKKENIEKCREWQRKYATNFYKKYPEKHFYRKLTEEEKIIFNKERYKKDKTLKERQARFRKKSKEELSDYYIKRLLTRHKKYSLSEITSEIIENKRKEILNLRLQKSSS
mgnify:CR=1 FL=1